MVVLWCSLSDRCAIDFHVLIRSKIWRFCFRTQHPTWVWNTWNIFSPFWDSIILSTMWSVLYCICYVPSPDTALKLSSVQRFHLDVSLYGLWSFCRYHPACVDLTVEEAKQLDHFICSEHGSDEDAKKPQENSLTNGKVSMLVFRQTYLLFPHLSCLSYPTKHLCIWCHHNFIRSIFILVQAETKRQRK